MRQINTAAVVLLVFPFLVQAAGAQSRDAKAVIADLRKLSSPMTASSPATQAASPDTSLATRSAALVAELFAIDTEDARVADFFGDRWRRMQFSHAQGLRQEIDQAIDTAKSKLVVAEAFIIRFNLAVFAATNDRAATYATLKVIADEFVKRTPDSKYLAGIYESLAGCAPDGETETVLLKKSVALAESPRVEARLKTLDLLGKPIELEFSDAISGRKINLRDLRGKVVVLDFWATWCGPCVAEMPAMKKVYADFKDRGVEFIGVTLDSPKAGGLDKVKAFVAKNDIAWPQYYQGKGWDAEFSGSLGIMSIPALLVIDRDGNVCNLDARGKLEQVLPPLLNVESDGNRKP